MCNITHTNVIYTHPHTPIHTHTNTQTHTCIHIYTHTPIPTHTHTHTHTHTGRVLPPSCAVNWRCLTFTPDSKEHHLWPALLCGRCWCWCGLEDRIALPSSDPASVGVPRRGGVTLSAPVSMWPKGNSHRDSHRNPSAWPRFPDGLWTSEYPLHTPIRIMKTPCKTCQPKGYTTTTTHTHTHTHTHTGDRCENLCKIRENKFTHTHTLDLVWFPLFPSFFVCWSAGFWSRFRHFHFFSQLSRSIVHRCL